MQRPGNEYDVFGSIIGHEGSEDSNYLFTGQEFDPESELYYYNARYYNPKIGRFISRDNFMGRTGDVISKNRYVYVKNNPLKYVDPTGEEEENAQKKNEVWLAGFTEGFNQGIHRFDPVLDFLSFGYWGDTLDRIDNYNSIILRGGSVNPLLYAGNIVGGGVTSGILGASWGMGAAEGLSLLRGATKYFRPSAIPQGLSSRQFKEASQMIRKEVGHISNDIFVHGSRANGTARAGSDIDFGIRVSPEKFEQLVRQRQSTLTVGSRSYNDLEVALERGRIFSSDIRLSGLKSQLKNILSMDVDISIIKAGGLFDQGPFILIK
ncbi:nucleotidyltransferase domain-containing protein [Patescibacteria group bacterium]|nr:nucleotidyltransferase domain-containing protein [Patescibacteria group bacterium]